MLQAFETQQPQTGGDPSFKALQDLLEAAEPAGAAANVLVFLLLKASPADQLPQVLSQPCSRPPTCQLRLLHEGFPMSAWWRCCVTDVEPVPWMPCHQCMRQAQDGAVAMPIWMISACRGWTLWQVAALQQAYCSRCARTRRSAWRCWRVRQLLRLHWQHQIQLESHSRQREVLHQRLASLPLKRKDQLHLRYSEVAPRLLAPAMRMLIPCWWCSGSSTHWIVRWKCCATDAAVQT